MCVKGKEVEVARIVVGKLRKKKKKMRKLLGSERKKKIKHALCSLPVPRRPLAVAGSEADEGGL